MFRSFVLALSATLVLASTAVASTLLTSSHTGQPWMKYKGFLWDATGFVWIPATPPMQGGTMEPTYAEVAKVDLKETRMGLGYWYGTTGWDMNRDSNRISVYATGTGYSTQTGQTEDLGTITHTDI